VRPLLLGAVLAAVLAAAACGSGGHKVAARNDAFAAPMVVSARRMAPNFRLRDQFGRPVSLDQFRGKAIGLTFVYSHCKNTCPLILQTLARSRDAVGRRFAVVAVSVDPAGDKPAHVRHWLAQRGLLHKVEFLLGTRAQLAPVWKQYDVGSKRVRGIKSDPELVEHTALIYGIDPQGLIRTLYPASPLDPRQVLHDASLLAGAA
jgi:protein SCO1/2